MLITVLAASLASLQVQDLDPVIVSFTTVGCDRVDVGDWKKDPDSNPSSANVAQVNQNLTDMASLPRKPDFVFLCGDLVANYRDDAGQVLEGQLKAFQSVVQGCLKAKGLRFIALPGNHELNQKLNGKKVPNLATDSIWASWLSQSGFAPPEFNGPKPDTSPSDKLANDQSRFNSSFATSGVQFVLLNTDTRTTENDPETGSPKVAWAPSYWAKAEIEQAQAQPSTKAIVVMGHRNLVDPESLKGDSPVDPVPAGVLTEAIRANSKVRLYSCSHVHAWDITKIGDNAWQVIEGRGGSPFEKGWEPREGQSFGFTEFQVHQSGRIDMIRHSRPFDSVKPALPDIRRTLGS